MLFGYFEFPSDVAMILKIILYKLLDVSSCKAVGLTKIYFRGCFWVETVRPEAEPELVLLGRGSKSLPLTVGLGGAEINLGTFSTL